MSNNNRSMVNGNNSHIPLRRSISKTNGTTTTTKIGDETNKWKMKFEESEMKRRALIAQNEKTIRNSNDLEKKYNNLQSKIDELETELFEKNESLAKVTTASRQLFHEYETLKSQYETETGAMHRALNDATNWYRENKVLRRRTMLMDKDVVDDGVDTDDSNGDLENLKESVKQLSAEIGQLQSELNAAKLLEFETSEQNANLIQELDNEREKRRELETEVAELKRHNEQIMRISNMMKKELEDLKQLEESQRNNVLNLRKEADSYKRERNVLKHQSTILLENLNPEGHTDSLRLLAEIEDLKRIVEDERNKHNMEITMLQEKLEDHENHSQTEVLEERLKLVEAELQEALQRAEKAEKAVPPPAPPLPPPPPPPPVVDFAGPPSVPLRTKKLSRSNVVPEIAATLGMEETNNNCGKKPAIGGVNDDIINQIKGGNFTLRKAKNENKKERETPKAVSELLNILGSLRRAPKNRPSLSNATFADVQL